MHRTVGLLWYCQLLLLSGTVASAEEGYEECKARCAQYYADCVNEPRGEEPEVQSAREAACNQKTEFCYSDCENRKPVLDSAEPENNPNVIRK